MMCEMTMKTFIIAVNENYIHLFNCLITVSCIQLHPLTKLHVFYLIISEIIS